MFKNLGLLSGFCFLAWPALAQESEQYSPAASWLPMFLSLLLVIAIIFMLSYLMKRFTGLHSSTGQIKTVASMMVGARERIVVIQVGEEQHVLGITSQNINHLTKLEQPLTSDATSDTFKEKLSGFMQKQSQRQEE